MKEITRIHIAKVSYDIELSAKKALEKYISALGVYANDDELLQDIEVRITELLAERGVGKDDIIADTDVSAVREKLGEPEAFADDESEAVLPIDESSRRLYRDQDNAVVGGVLSGIAAFFRINPLWVRLAFIVSIFISYGAALLVYVVLWLAVPPARTAAEKLRMSGQPVTLGSIRAVSEQDTTRRSLTERRVRIIKRILTVGAGIFCLFVAIVAMVAIVAGGWTFGVQRGQFSDVNPTILMTMVGLFLLSGLLLVTLAIMGAYTAFARKATKRQIISAVIIIVLGLGAFGAGLGMAGYQSWLRSDMTQRNTKEVTTRLPAAFSTVTSLKINAPGVATLYVVSDDVRMTLVSLPNYTASYTLDDTSATISVKQRTATDDRFGYAMPVLTIYGPALSQLDVANGQVSYQAQTQEALKVHILANASQSFAGDSLVRVSGGVINKLSIVSDNTMQTTISASDAAVRDVEAQLRAGDTLQLGKVASVNVSYPDVCPSGASLTTISLGALQSATMILNQKTVAAKSTSTACGTVTFDEPNSQSDY